MTIVDTPSFDFFPEELEMFKVKEIIEIFHEFFENEESVEELDMICNLGDEICSSFLRLRQRSRGKHSLPAVEQLREQR
jgi:hypothetical protein